MADTYVFIIHEPDWDSDEFLGRPRDHEGSAENKFPEHAAFAEAVAKLGATVTGGQALQNRKYGGSVTPGAGERKVADAVYSDASYADTSEVITGFYMVEVADENQAREIAALVPTGNRIEWRKVFPMGE
jgi:hypothetical protein